MSEPKLIIPMWSIHEKRMWDMMRWCDEICDDLNIADHQGLRPVHIVFRDYDPAYDGEFRHGWADGNVVHIWVGDYVFQPTDALKWIIAHELRHVHQSYHGTIDPNGPVPASYNEYLVMHDILPEEIDADRYANSKVNFDYGQYEEVTVEPHNRRVRGRR